MTIKVWKAGPRLGAIWKSCLDRLSRLSLFKQRRSESSKKELDAAMGLGIGLSKSRFLEYLKCPAYCWLITNKPAVAQEYIDQAPADEPDSLAAIGGRVEQLAQSLFPEGVTVKSQDPVGRWQETEALIESGQITIFQATAITKTNIQAAADIISRDPDDEDGWILYEVKSSNRPKPKDHYPDIAFQKLALETAGIKINQSRLIHLNPDYIQRGVIADLNNLFIHENGRPGIDLSAEIDQCLNGTSKYLAEPLEPMTAAAWQTLRQLEEPDCRCHLKTANQQCPTVRYFHQDIPEYSIYNIRRISKKKIIQMRTAGVIRIEDVGSKFDLSDTQRCQVDLHPDKKITRWPEIKQTLDQIKTPVYFLDYETYSPAIPEVIGSGPHWQLPFLFALSRLDDPESRKSIDTVKLIQTMSREGLEDLATEIENLISNSGSVIVWHESFERMVNNNLGKVLPHKADLFADINSRLFDLETIFSRQLYIDGAFRGKTSVKNIAGVIRPDLDYGQVGLDIQKGDQATQEWLRAIKPTTVAESRQEIFDQLKKYCRHDVLVMVAIYQFLLSGGRI